jgi:hypothetical protein
VKLAGRQHFEEFRLERMFGEGVQS